jgi:hypothetical protein
MEGKVRGWNRVGGIEGKVREWNGGKVEGGRGVYM